jgi:prophage maintenance system killer protein
MKKRPTNTVIIYQLQNGALQLKTDGKGETIWASLTQIAELFDTDRSGISRHINKIYDSNELSSRATVAKYATVQIEGSREVAREIEFYNLDVILSVGYRVNSAKATHFRQWATKTLKDHIQKGYTLNRQRIKANHEEFINAVEKVKSLLPVGGSVPHDSVLELIKLFADTWFSLDAYDRDILSPTGTTKRKAKLTGDKLASALSELKSVLIAKGEATEIFGVERTKDSIASIVGNVMQSFGDQDLYPTLEEKAANLLYFIIKNHPFVDGNKRSGAYAFIWFLNRSKILNTNRMSPPALTALTILIAESNPKDKEKMIGLVCALLK